MTSLVEVIDAGRLRLRNFFSKMREHSIPSGLHYFDTFELDGQTEREHETYDRCDLWFHKEVTELHN